tara:strand:+ start:228 stop:692 length:465 start_codon:yes stop_codon:yes gene_type:complete
MREFLKPDLLEISNLDSRPWPKDHVTLQELYDIMDTDEFNSFYKFAIIRNPYDRLGSIYNYLLGGRTPADLFNIHKGGLPIHNNESQFSFENFILNLPKYKEMAESSNESYKNIISSITDYLSVNGEIKVNRVIPFENLNEDLEIIQKKTRFDW